MKDNANMNNCDGYVCYDAWLCLKKRWIAAVRNMLSGNIKKDNKKEIEKRVPDTFTQR